MRRSVVIVCSVILASVALFAGAFILGSQLSCHHLSGSPDDLNWLRVEFSLSNVELEEIRKLHEGYLPVCEKYCAEIEEAKWELQLLIQQNPDDAEVVAAKLQNIADIRAQCQAAMLAHFEAVSHEMPHVQGERYLAEMWRLTLDFHEQIENSMTGNRGQEHGHH